MKSHQLHGSELLVAERAVHALASPLLDAVRVEVVPLVAGQGRNHFTHAEVAEADRTLLMVVEAHVEGARHLIECARHRLRLAGVRPSESVWGLAWGLSVKSWLFSLRALWYCS